MDKLLLIVVLSAVVVASAVYGSTEERYQKFIYGAGLFFWIVIILYFVQKKRGGKYITVFRVAAWMLGISSLYYCTYDIPIAFLISLIIITLSCFLMRNKNGVWKVGFWTSLVYVIFNVVVLLFIPR